jgi:hypothetical protein
MFANSDLNDIAVNPFIFPQLLGQKPKEVCNKECGSSYNIDISFNNMIETLKKEKYYIQQNKTNLFKKFKDVTKIQLNNKINITEINPEINYTPVTADSFTATNTKQFTNKPILLSKKKKSLDELFFPNIKADNLNIHLDIKNININNQQLNEYQQV